MTVVVTNAVFQQLALAETAVRRSAQTSSGRGSQTLSAARLSRDLDVMAAKLDCCKLDFDVPVHIGLSDCLPNPLTNLHAPALQTGLVTISFKIVSIV